MGNERIRDYLIERLIGAGGMGMVYLAKHENLHRYAAIKVLLENLSANPQIRERFIQEARLMGSLDHPNIVTLYDFTTEPKLSLIMEFVDGRGLDEMIGQDVGPIPWEKALPLFTQILDGIGYAHSKGIVHRDIKPANILISKDGQVKVTDLGIAKIAGQQGMTRTGTQMGTLYYEAPEQIKGAKDVDNRSDIYALGMTLYEMLAGRLPFETGGATSEFEIMNSIVYRKEHLDPREYYPHVPEWLVKSIQRATVLDPNERFQSCEEFKQVISKNSMFSDKENGFWSARVSSSESEQSEPSLGAISSKAPIAIPSDQQCPGCGSEINKELKFCDTCGEKLEKECPVCQFNIRWNKNFCPQCGADYLKIAAEKNHLRIESIQTCPLCKAEVDKESESCFTCGAMLSRKCISCGYSNQINASFCSGCGVNLPDIVEIVANQQASKMLQKHDGALSSASFVRIPAGSFMMGVTRALGSNDSDFSFPRHRVMVSSFELMTTQVTQIMWEKYMGSNPSQFVFPSNPVENISWNDCQDFIGMLNELDPKHRYRLPSEAEWEYACRAGSDSRYFWGNEMDEAYCWSRVNSNSETHPVGSKLPNRWKLFDMSGNVWEWCQDSWANNYIGAPCDGTAWESSDIVDCVRRGGGWVDDEDNCCSASRGCDEAEDKDFVLGFRLVRERM